MRTAVLVLGIIGCVLGIFSGLVFLGSVSATGGTVRWEPVGALGFSLLGGLAGLVTHDRPRLGALGLLMAAMGLCFSVTIFAALPIILFLIGAGLAFTITTSPSDRVRLHT